MENFATEIKSCEVCGNEEIELVLNLGMHPMCDDLVPIDDERVCKEYPIEILFCKNCNTAHQHFQVPKHELFPATYHYRSRFTADVLNGMAELVDSCEKRFGIFAGKQVLDIGCNDGSLLDYFHKKGSITLGIEPTDAFRDAEAKGHKSFNNFLSVEVAQKIVSTHGKPDFICFTNVFAHIENLDEVLSSLKILMSASTIIIIENHYLGAVLEGNQFDTFYHEHPRTYSYTSFAYMAQSLGVKLLAVEFPKRYGGNIRVFLGNATLINQVSSADTFQLSALENKFNEKFTSLKYNMDNWCKAKKNLIQKLVKKNGKIRAKAFPGRAAILVKLLGLNEELISAVYEKPGSLKIGHYLPGTRIPIYSDNDLFALEDKTLPLLNLAWHIPREIRAYMMDNNYSGEIIDIISSEDFE
jgi:hypothetical protein